MRKEPSARQDISGLDFNPIDKKVSMRKEPSARLDIPGLDFNLIDKKVSMSKSHRLDKIFLDWISIQSIKG